MSASSHTVVHRAAIEAANRANLPSASATDKQAASMPGRFRDTLSLRKGPPFIASNDIARGVINQGGDNFNISSCDIDDH